MAFSTQITRAERHVARRTGASYPKHSPAHVTRQLGSTRTSKALIARAQPQGTGSGDVCDPPNVYNQGPDAQKVVRHVQGADGGREYDAPTVEETVVNHDVERIKPVIHQEVHQTRLHEATHHKTESPRDMGVTEVVQHGDTDPCGNRVSEDLNAVRGSADTTTGYGNESDTHGSTKKPVDRGLKGAINELLPGSGPFKEKV